MKSSTKRLKLKPDCFAVKVKTRFSSVGAPVIRLFCLGNQIFLCNTPQDPEPTLGALGTSTRPHARRHGGRVYIGVPSTLLRHFDPFPHENSAELLYTGKLKGSEATE